MSEIQIKSVRWYHEAMIDLMIETPNISQGEIARKMGYTESWISIIVNSDAFQERLAERRGELIDPKLRASIKDRLDGLAKRALDKMLERLDTNAPIKNSELVEFAKLGCADLLNAKAPALQQNLYVIQAPPKAPSTSAWTQMVEEIQPLIPGRAASEGPFVPQEAAA